MIDVYDNVLEDHVAELVDMEIKKLAWYYDYSSVDGFWVSIDYDFWNDEKHKKETFNHLARYFPRIQSGDDEVLAHIPFGFDNFGGINA